jgi:molecular chaperone GrpE
MPPEKNTEQGNTEQNAHQASAAVDIVTPQPEAPQPEPAARAPQHVATAMYDEIAANADSATPTVDIVDDVGSAVDLAAALREAEARAAEHRDAWLRAKAEAENIRRRAQEDVAKASKFAAEKFASAMLPVKDSLETALAIENQTLEKLREGVELTLKQLGTAFEGANLKEENPLQQKFDPNRHQAIGMIESDAEPNTVIQVLQKAYLLHGRVIRPAMVMVAKARTEAKA